MSNEKLEVYIANPHFYSDNEGNVFGTFALTEDVLTGLPLNPKDMFLYDNEQISVWKLMMVSTTKDSCIGDMDYYKAIENLKKFSIGEKDEYIIIQPLKLNEQLEVLNN